MQSQFLIVGLFLALGLSVQAVPPRKQSEPEQARVRLKVLSVLPETGTSGSLAFRIRLELSNLTGRPVFIQTQTRESRHPYFIRYYKRLNYRPYWLFLGPFLDALAEGFLTLSAGESIQFEEVIGCASAHRMPFEEGIPVRGVHRARLRYFLTHEDMDKARRHEEARMFWAISESFRIDWPSEPHCPYFSQTKEAR